MVHMFFKRKGRISNMGRIADRTTFEQQDSFGIGAPNDAFARILSGIPT